MLGMLALDSFHATVHKYTHSALKMGRSGWKMATAPLMQHAAQKRGDGLMDSELSQLRSARSTVSHTLTINH